MASAIVSKKINAAGPRIAAFAGPEFTPGMVLTRAIDVRY
jgi:hypothetical protein